MEQRITFAEINENESFESGGKLFKVIYKVPLGVHCEVLDNELNKIDEESIAFPFNGRRKG